MTPISQNACLVVIDGWGVSDEGSSHKDAIKSANIPFMQSLDSHPLKTTIEAHGLAVGLPAGLMGNSEVGHLNIGAGRVVYQDIVRIEQSIQNNTFESNPILTKLLTQASVGTGSRLHLLGLLSDGGVHSHIDHLNALIRAAKDAHVPNCYLHCFSDGRDSGQKSFMKYYEQLNDSVKANKYGTIGTIIGRYYAMDRDKRLERTQLALDCLVGSGAEVENVNELIAYKYSIGEYDEFFKPIVVDTNSAIKPNDICIFFNFRSDRMRQLVRMLNDHFEGKVVIATMTQYSSEFTFPILFPPQQHRNTLAEWISKHNLAQCHLAETEKYAHVTFFFNGGREQEWPGEERCLIPSPKVATYDLKPEMSIGEVTSATIDAIESHKFQFIVCNFAPPDMVGHTGNFEAAIRAVEATDSCLKQVWEVCRHSGYALFITADHGNAEVMTDSEGNPYTAHTCSRVPFIALLPDSTASNWSMLKENGSLCDVAPTILTVAGLPIPAEMTGKSLLLKNF